MNLKINWDGLGIITSIACAIHCAILPLLLTSLPLFGVNIINNMYFEWGMIGLAFLVGAYSLFHGFVKHHHSILPVAIFASGFAFLVTKQFFHHYEYLLLPPAVILIVYAHYINYRLCSRSKCSTPGHSH